MQRIIEKKGVHETNDMEPVPDGGIAGSTCSGTGESGRGTAEGDGGEDKPDGGQHQDDGVPVQSGEDVRLPGSTSSPIATRSS